MSAWTRAHGGQRCGGCGALLAAGDPVLVIPVGARRTLLRCGACRQAPPDLPVVIARVPEGVDPGPVFTRLGLLPLDFSARRLGEGT